jgi:hypothetical protein
MRMQLPCKHKGQPPTAGRRFQTQQTIVFERAFLRIVAVNNNQ